MPLAKNLQHDMREYTRWKNGLNRVSEYKARQFIHLYSQGVPAKEIADRWGCAPSQVEKVLKDAKVYQGKKHQSW